MRRVWQIVLLTSAIWFFLDVFALFFLLDVKSAPNSRGKHFEAKEEEIRPEQPAEERTDVVFPTLKEKSVDEGILAKLMKGLRLDGGGPGEMGKAVKLGKEEEAEMKEKFKLNQFNLMASDMISLNRSLPDVRNSHCRKQSYEGVQMPHTSVVIVFHNEAWSTLLRSLHSVINRSPRSLLREFVLVDDCSDRDYLRGALDFYVKTLPIPTKIIHLPNRKGLVYARLQGAKVASGAVLTFLDAHIEVTTGWLEPLLSRIAEDRTRVVCPVIDVISDDTFEYVSASDMTWGGFNWKLQFRWYSVPQREIARRNGDRSKPLRSPTMAGGLFSIDKSYFYEVGSYDDGMKIWGGENLEMSFRVWQCGGSVEICPCSHVGHVFRKQTPYSFPGGTAAVIHGNAARTAEVWMDSGYKNFFYAITPGAKAVDIGSVVERLEFRKKKQCKSFKWYLENIYPEGHIPITYYSLGWVRNVGERSCLDTMSRKDGQNAGASGCHGLGGNQAWSLTGLSEIRNDESCLESVDQRQIRLQKCHKAKGNQEWFYDPQTKLVKHVSSGKCISVKGEEITLDTCTAGASSQMWTFENFDPNMHQTDGSDGEKL